VDFLCLFACKLAMHTSNMVACDPVACKRLYSSARVHMHAHAHAHACCGGLVGDLVYLFACMPM